MPGPTLHALRFAIPAIPPFFPFFPRYPSDISRHPTTSLGAPNCRVTFSNMWGGRTESSFGAAAAVLAHGGGGGGGGDGGGGRLSKSQAP